MVVWDVGVRRIVYKLPGHKGVVNDVDWHPREPIGKKKKKMLGVGRVLIYILILIFNSQPSLSLSSLLYIQSCRVAMIAPCSLEKSIQLKSDEKKKGGGGGLERE